MSQQPSTHPRDPAPGRHDPRKRTIVVALVAVVLLIVAGAVGYSVFRSQAAPTESARPGATIAPGSKLNIFADGDHPWSMLIRSDAGGECGLAANHTVPPCSLLIPEGTTVMRLEATFQQRLIYDQPPRDGFRWYGCDEGPRSETCTFTVTRPGGICITGVDPEFVRVDGCKLLYEDGVLDRLPKAPPEFSRVPVSNRLTWSFPPGVCQGKSGVTRC
ncbi:hypothetical protein [Nocardia sp. NPDC057455]|uniref:hypothetical protein n=1 Tax=Nocardia sp. NPDC057455 TaxID=3346138 RepID=UPI00366F50E7